MFPIVQIMLGRGFTITGSDNNEGDALAAEREMGVKITLGHSAENLGNADAVVFSAAIAQDNPELACARERGIPIIERSEMLGYLTRQYSDCICVAGTHGKTTATSMISQILLKSGFDPATVIGGKLPLIGGSGRSGSGTVMTCEADEFARTFLKLSPDIAVILNIDEDHMDIYGTMGELKSAFRRFAQNASRRVIANGDDENTVNALEGMRFTSFGFSAGNDYFPENITPLDNLGSRFDLMCKGGKLCTIELAVIGRHNILNAVAACAAALEVGVKPHQLAAGLDGFTGAGRRFEVLGKVNGFTVVDDYAHHPAEIEVTMNAAMKLGYNKVWAVFQPFTFSRTSMLLDSFAQSLSIPDKTVVSKIMGGRETNTYGIYAKDLTDKIPGSVYMETFEEIAAYILENAEAGDLVVTMGCGDVYKCAKLILEKGRPQDR
ncbi:MAG: UDP-N-acetylmuramate--L-alanine ligase [Oscillospiraceae bacterium]|nr:UDP-N-acetylmuramate--L-alanine ligase [Oscillospiraceae bacterium]